MLIKKITPRLIEREIEGGFFNPRIAWDKKRILLVFVEGENGLLGVGEAWMSGGSVRPVIDVIEDELAPSLVGQSIHRIPAFLESVKRSVEMSNRSGLVAAAFGAVESAIWDLRARALGLPLADLLGRARDRIPVYASAGLYGPDKTPEDLGAELKGYVDQGFDAVKIKIGGASHAEDVRRVAAAREAIGPDVRLMVDALYNLDVAQAIAMARAIEPYDIHFLEAPVSPFDIAGQARVAAATPIALCGNENQAWCDYFRDLILADATHFVQFDLAACGGIEEGRRVASLARTFHRPCTLHAASSAVLFASSLHLAAACPGPVSVEYHMFHQWLWDLVPAGTFEAKDGHVSPPSGPGIGIDLDPDSLG